MSQPQLWLLKVTFDIEPVLLIQAAVSVEEAREKMLKCDFSELFLFYGRVPLHVALNQPDKCGFIDDESSFTKNIQVPVVVEKKYKIKGIHIPASFGATEAKHVLDNLTVLHAELSRIASIGIVTEMKKVKDLREAIEIGYIQAFSNTLYVNPLSG